MWSRRIWASAIVIASALGCRQILGLTDPPLDASNDSMATPCATTGVECASDSVLRTCTTVGELPTDIDCAWGCSLGDASPRCAIMSPSGGAVLSTDLDPSPQLTATTITGPATFNSDTGSISGVRALGVGVSSGIEFVTRGNVGIFRFASLQITGTVLVRGTNAVAFVAIDRIDLQGEINVVGECLGTSAGPGGYQGGARQSGAAGSGAGGGGGTFAGDASGAGGGGAGASGATGGLTNGIGSGASAGPAFGDLQISVLRGGGGGGGGGGTDGGFGGGGGGAVQLIANRSITVATGGINAGGCGGGAGLHGGGGGGAGGTILIEAAQVEINGAGLAANGGGGGGGGTGTTVGQTGMPGPLSVMRAQGGVGVSPGADGGMGGARGSLGGGTASAASDMGGGGGGGAGRIRITTASGAVVFQGGAFLSPDLPDGTATIGVASVR